MQGKRINPYHVIEDMEYPKCSEAILRLTPKIGGCMNKIREMIEEIPTLSEIQKQFFILIIEHRYEKVFLPVYEKLMEKEFGISERENGRCK